MTSESQPRSETKPRVMRFITRMNVGGPAMHVLVLSDGLSQRGYDHVLVSGMCEEAEGDVAIPFPSGQHIIGLPRLSRSVSPWKDVLSIWQAYRLIRQHQPDIVHTHTAKAGLVGRIAARVAGVPIIVHTFHGNSLSGYFSPLANTCFQSIEKLLARLTHRICVVSNQQLDEITERFCVGPRDRFAVVPLGIDLSAALESSVREVENGTLNIGWLGRLVPIKGVRLLVDVIDAAVERGLAVRFLIGGDGPERGLLQKCVAKHGEERVQWLGWQPNATDFVGRCHLMIQTSRNEGTPVALIQGMAAARPFVSTPVGGVVDMLSGPPQRTDHGCRWFANGVLVNPDSAAFVEAFDQIQRRPACLAEMGLAARTFAVRTYRAERLVGDLDVIYRELLAAYALSKHKSDGRTSMRNITGESQCTY
jgi:glycosyltransferase involved in cell wall biosynthesis